MILRSALQRSTVKIGITEFSMRFLWLSYRFAALAAAGLALSACGTTGFESPFGNFPGMEPEHACGSARAIQIRGPRRQLGGGVVPDDSRSSARGIGGAQAMRKVLSHRVGPEWRGHDAPAQSERGAGDAHQDFHRKVRPSSGRLASRAVWGSRNHVLRRTRAGVALCRSGGRTPFRHAPLCALRAEGVISTSICHSGRPCGESRNP